MERVMTFDEIWFRSVFNQITINALYDQKMERGCYNMPEHVKETMLLFWEGAYKKALSKNGYVRLIKEKNARYV